MGYAASRVQARTPSDHAEAKDAYGGMLEILQLEPPQRGKLLERMGQIKENDIPLVSRRNSEASGVQQRSQTMDPVSAGPG